ncbi:hypothetical protein EMMF5_005985 [Cystobasidiomycetes sp. EMM_F5]
MSLEEDKQVAAGHLPPNKALILLESGTIADVALSNLEITAYGHASTPGRAVLDGRQILDRIPEISQVVDIVQVIEASSLQYKTVEYLKLARLIKTIDTPVVVTRGTSDIPELAFFLDVTLNRQLPVVVTGSMRPMSALSSDAKYNLLQACSLAGSDAARARGVLVALGDRITSGYYAVKLSANRMDTFKAIEAGQLGFFVNWHPQFFFEPARPSNKPFFGGTVLDNENMVTLPKVASVCSRVNQEKDELQEAIRRGIHGLVFANWAAVSVASKGQGISG